MSTEIRSPEIDARRTDCWLASVVMVFAFGALWFSKGMSVMGSIFPRSVAIMMLIFSIALLVRALVAHPRLPAAERGNTGRRLGLVAVLLVWGLSLRWLGFIASSLLCAGALVWLAHYHAWTSRRVLAYALVLIAIIAFFYALFAVLLNVPLPVGDLWRS